MLQGSLITFCLIFGKFSLEGMSNCICCVCMWYVCIRAVVIARDETAQMGLERETYDHMGRRELSEALYRYDMNTTYYLRG